MCIISILLYIHVHVYMYSVYTNTGLHVRHNVIIMGISGTFCMYI